MDEQRYRVAQWATGNIGLRSLRAVIEHPQLDLVGLYVYSDAKVGRDAGELCGLDPVGVTATRDIDDILAAAPDCVVYMGDRADIDVMCQLLEGGINLVCTRSEFHRPAGLDTDIRNRIEAACAEGGTTLHSTGVSPGFITEAMPFVLTSIQRRLDCLTIEEFADMSSRNSPEMIFKLMGFGRQPEDFDPTGTAQHEVAAFGPSLAMVADALSLPLDDIVGTGEAAVARKTTEIAAGTVEAGTVAAQRFEVKGVHGGRTLLRFRANWYLTTDVEPAWDLRETGWHLLVEGDTPLDIDIRFPVPAEEYPTMSPGLTAHRPVNAIPYVVAASPGIRTTAELPQIIANLGR
ncbi:MAG: dihydrodipicolinate reductase [Actinomycetia bacterium]|nr:dihydrodipicolinate reductase [Actinomycetes bacterium]